MSDFDLKLELYGATQGHKQFKAAWDHAKPLLHAGHKLELTIAKPKRTAAQNRRYWGKGVLHQVAEKAAGGKYSAESWHELFKRMFIGFDELPNGDVIGKSTTGLDRAQFCDFCTQVEAYATTELGVVFEELEPNK